MLPGNDLTISRSVDENTPMGEPVGEAIVATDEDIDDGGKLAYSLQGTDASKFGIDPDTGQILVLSPLDYETKSQYEVTVTVIDNQTGSDTETVNITVVDLLEKPDTPAAPNVDAGTYANTLDVTWTEPGNTGPEIINYHIRYLKNTETVWQRWTQEQSAATQTTLMGLQTNTSYQVQVRAYNEELWSDWSTSRTGRTANNDSPRFPDGEETTRSIMETPGNQTETTARSVGEAVTAQDTDSGDQVSYTLTGTNSSKFSINLLTGQISTKTGTRHDYEAISSYKVEVIASDNHSPNEGRSTIDVTINILDANEPPVKPTALTFTNTSRYQTTVNWRAPDNIGRPDITHYEVRYKLEDDSEYPDPISTEDEDSQSSLTLINLEDGETYEVQVRGFNEEGEGAWSDAAEVNTPANKHPVFRQGSSTTRNLPENSAENVTVGNPVEATDQDGDTITY